MADINRIGFGQVEPNHLSAQRNGQVYGQLPAAEDIKQLENGQFVKYDYANGECNFTGAGEWMLVMNEVKLYDTWRESYKDFALVSTNFDKGQMTPRVFKTMVGDIYTTNCLVKAGTRGQKTEGITVALKDQLSPNAQGFLALDGDGSIVFEVVKVYTMPDGQPAVKLMRIK